MRIFRHSPRKETLPLEVRRAQEPLRVANKPSALCGDTTPGFRGLSAHRTCAFSFFCPSLPLLQHLLLLLLELGLAVAVSQD